jgi:polyketide cyclase/dehydrase/lipid transport protein
MPSVKHSIDIAAPVDDVFSYVADHPERATAFIPGLNRIGNVSSPEAGVGQTWEYEFNWFGLVITGNSRCTRLERPSVYQFQTVTGNPSTWTYRFAPKGDGTHVDFEVEYTIPENQIARFATAGTLERMNEERSVEVLANLKGLLEE